MARLGEYEAKEIDQAPERVRGKSAMNDCQLVSGDRLRVILTNVTCLNSLRKSANTDVFGRYAMKWEPGLLDRLTISPEDLQVLDGDSRNLDNKRS